MCKILCTLQKCSKNWFFVVELTWFYRVAVISLNYDENTCDQQLTCYQTLLRFHIGQTQMFSDSFCLGLMENQDKRPAKQVSAVSHSREHFDY